MKAEPRASGCLSCCSLFLGRAAQTKMPLPTSLREHPKGTLHAPVQGESDYIAHRTIADSASGWPGSLNKTKFLEKLSSWIPGVGWLRNHEESLGWASRILNVTLNFLTSEAKIRARNITQSLISTKSIGHSFHFDCILLYNSNNGALLFEKHFTHILSLESQNNPFW